MRDPEPGGGHDDPDSRDYVVSSATCLVHIQLCRHAGRSGGEHQWGRR